MTIKVHDKNGFTLVEVLIVIAIIALLASIAIPNLLRARMEANDSVARSTLKTIALAMETYASTNTVYPPNTTVLISASPQYLGVDYFSGNHGGYAFTINNLTPNAYSVNADPVSSTLGIRSYTITTGGMLTAN